MAGLPNGQMINLSFFLRQTISTAVAINELGQVIGFCESNVGSGLFPYLYEDGVMLDLNTLLVGANGWHIAEANAMDQRWRDRQALAAPDGTGHAVLLTPIPEPIGATVASVVLGVVSLRRTRR